MKTAPIREVTSELYKDGFSKQPGTISNYYFGAGYSVFVEQNVAKHLCVSLHLRRISLRLPICAEDVYAGRHLAGVWM